MAIAARPASKDAEAPSKDAEAPAGFRLGVVLSPKTRRSYLSVKVNLPVVLVKLTKDITDKGPQYISIELFSDVMVFVLCDATSKVEGLRSEQVIVTV